MAASSFCHRIRSFCGAASCAHLKGATAMVSATRATTGSKCFKQAPPRVSDYTAQSANLRLLIKLMNMAGLALHEIHQQVLAKILRRSEVSFAAAHLRDLLHKIDQRIVGREHESIDHDVGAFA